MGVFLPITPIKFIVLRSRFVLQRPLRIQLSTVLMLVWVVQLCLNPSKPFLAVKKRRYQKEVLPFWTPLSSNWYNQTLCWWMLQSLSQRRWNINWKEHQTSLVFVALLHSEDNGDVDWSCERILDNGSQCSADCLMVREHKRCPCQMHPTKD